MKKISIGIPCYNEEGNVELMYKSITDQMNKLPNYDYEIIFEDNNSSDSTQLILREIAQDDKRVKVIFNQANFGPMRSGTNCMGSITGDAYIAIPCDFQEPPEMIPEFVGYWEKGYDVVWGTKTSSKENKIKFFLRKIYYCIIDFFAEFPQLSQVTGFGIMDKSVLGVLMVTKRQDPSVAVRHLIMEYGFKIKLIPYTQQKRESGKSSYNISSYLSFAISSLCNTSTKPLRMMTILGFITSFISLFFGIVYFVYKLIYWDTFSVGIAPLMIGLFFCSAVQLICVGILGEYIGIILKKITHKPIVVERERLNFEEDIEK